MKVTKYVTEKEHIGKSFRVVTRHSSVPMGYPMGTILTVIGVLNDWAYQVTYDGAPSCSGHVTCTADVIDLCCTYVPPVKNKYILTQTGLSHWMHDLAQQDGDVTQQVLNVFKLYKAGIVTCESKGHYVDISHIESSCVISTNAVSVEELIKYFTVIS